MRAVNSEGDRGFGVMRGRLEEMMVLKDELSELQGGQGELIVPTPSTPPDELACLFNALKSFQADLAKAGIPSFLAEVFARDKWITMPRSAKKTTLWYHPWSNTAKKKILQGDFVNRPSLPVYHKESLSWLLGKMNISQDYLQDIGVISAIKGQKRVFCGYGYREFGGLG